MPGILTCSDFRRRTCMELKPIERSNEPSIPLTHCFSSFPSVTELGTNASLFSIVTSLGRWISVPMASALDNPKTDFRSDFEPNKTPLNLCCL